MTRQSNLRSGTLQGRSVAAFVDWLTRAMRAHRGGGGLTCVCDALCRNGITVWLQCTTEAHRLPLLCTTLRAQTHSPEPRRGSRSSNVRPTPTLSLHWQATRLILPESAPLTLRSVFVLGPLACLVHTHEATQPCLDSRPILPCFRRRRKRTPRTTVSCSWKRRPRQRRM